MLGNDADGKHNDVDTAPKYSISLGAYAITVLLFTDIDGFCEFSKYVLESPGRVMQFL